MSEKTEQDEKDTSTEEKEETSEHKLPGAPAKDGSALGDTDQHSDA